jgi:hypothetical protein
VAKARVLRNKGPIIVLSGEKATSLNFFDNGGIQVCLITPFSKDLIRGLTPGEVRAGKVQQCAGTERKGDKIITYINLSSESAKALKELLNLAL